MEVRKLNPKQELFCKLYATDREFFGNGVESYAEAYDIDITDPKKYASARAMAAKALSKVNITAKINSILEETGFNDTFIDKQLSFIIAQHADFGAKISAIKEYNKLKQRIIDRQDITTNGKELPAPIYGGKSKEV